MQLETDMAGNPSLRYVTSAMYASDNRECVEARLVACGDGVGGHETLDVVGTLLKGGERFLEI